MHMTNPRYRRHLLRLSEVIYDLSLMALWTLRWSLILVLHPILLSAAAFGELRYNPSVHSKSAKWIEWVVVYSFEHAAEHALKAMLIFRIDRYSSSMCCLLENCTLSRDSDFEQNGWLPARKGCKRSSQENSTWRWLCVGRYKWQGEAFDDTPRPNHGCYWWLWLLR